MAMNGTLRFSIVLFACVIFFGVVAIAAEKSTEIVTWRAQPDPPPAAPVPATRPTTQPAADPLRLKATIALSPISSKNPERDLIAPERSSRFVLSVSGFFGGYELWDLRLGDKVKGGNTKFDLNEMALSPDGQYLAGEQRRGRAQLIEIWSLKTGQIAGHLTEVDFTRQVQIAGFVDPNRILLYSTGATPENRWQLFDIPTGKIVLKWADDATFTSSRAAVADWQISGTGERADCRRLLHRQRPESWPTRSDRGRAIRNENGDPLNSLATFSPNGQSLAVLPDRWREKPARAGLP